MFKCKSILDSKWDTLIKVLRTMITAMHPSRSDNQLHNVFTETCHIAHLRVKVETKPSWVAKCLQGMRIRCELATHMRETKHRRL